jgi:hypothetical protein
VLCLTCLTLALTGPADLSQLIARLGDRDFRIRETAWRDLERLGPAALPALREARKHKDPEVRKRVEEIIPAIEARHLLTPKLITLKAKNKSPRQLAEELSKQSGYKVEVEAAADKDVYTLDVKEQPFWKVVDELSRIAGVGLTQLWYGDDRVRLAPVDRHSPHVWHDGPFRVSAAQFQLSRTVNLEPSVKGQQTIDEQLTLNLNLFTEPKLPVLSLGEPRLEAAYDSEKNSLVPPPPSEAPAVPGQFAMRGRLGRIGPTGHLTLFQQTGVPLRRVSPRADRVKLVRGTIPVTLLIEQKPTVVTDNLTNARGKTIKVGTTTFRIEEILAEKNQQIQLRMNLTEEQAGDGSAWTSSLNRRLEVSDEKGQRLESNGSGWSQNSPGQVQLTLYFPPQAGRVPTKLVYQVWKTMPYQVGFEFRDVPLP